MEHFMIQGCTNAKIANVKIVEFHWSFIRNMFITFLVSWENLKIYLLQARIHWWKLQLPKGDQKLAAHQRLPTVPGWKDQPWYPICDGWKTWKQSSKYRGMFGTEILFEQTILSLVHTSSHDTRRCSAILPGCRPWRPSSTEGSNLPVSAQWRQESICPAKLGVVIVSIETIEKAK